MEYIAEKRINLHVRWMNRPDMDEVLRIENLSMCEWVEEDFLRCLRQRNCIGMVVDSREGSGDVIGFMIYELEKSSLHIVKFAVHPAWRRRGVGRRMCEKLESKLSSHRRTYITVDVRETNLAALQFFRSQAYLAVGVRRGWYDDTGEDAVEMRYDFADVGNDW